MCSRCFLHHSPKRLLLIIEEGRLCLDISTVCATVLDFFIALSPLSNVAKVIFYENAANLRNEAISGCLLISLLIKLFRLITSYIETENEVDSGVKVAIGVQGHLVISPLEYRGLNLNLNCRKTLIKNFCKENAFPFNSLDKYQYLQT